MAQDHSEALARLHADPRYIAWRNGTYESPRYPGRPVPFNPRGQETFVNDNPDLIPPGFTGGIDTTGADAGTFQEAAGPLRTILTGAGAMAGPIAAGILAPAGAGASAAGSIAGGLSEAGIPTAVGIGGGGGSALGGLVSGRGMSALGSILGGAAAGRQQQQNTEVDQSARLAALGLQAPAARLQTGLRASLAENFTPQTLSWGGPGSGLRGEMPTYSGGLPAAMGQTQQDPMIQRLIEIAKQGQTPEEFRRPAPSGADRALGAAATGTSLLGGILSALRR